MTLQERVLKGYAIITNQDVRSQVQGQVQSGSKIYPGHLLTIETFDLNMANSTVGMFAELAFYY